MRSAVWSYSALPLRLRWILYWERHIPIIGVVKGEGPAGVMIQKLGLTKEYELAANRFREKLCGDPDTLVYDCEEFDEEALRLAKAWVKEYANG